MNYANEGINLIANLDQDIEPRFVKSVHRTQKQMVLKHFTKQGQRKQFSADFRTIAAPIHCSKILTTG